MKDRLLQDGTGARDAVRRDRVRRQSRRRAALRTVAVLPTMLTLGNVLSGFMAIVLASRPVDTALPFGWTPLTFAALFIFLGMLMDGLDGRVARLTRSTSDLGEQLDSMADMVTFGLAPAFLAVTLVGPASPLSASADVLDRFATIVAFIYVACAALRLARFNIESRSDAVNDHLSFSGLPSPGAAGTVASMVLLHEHFVFGLASEWVSNSAKTGMVIVMLLAAFAMVSRLPYVHAMNRYVPRRAPFSTIVMVVIGVLLLFIHFQGVVAAMFVLYALSAPGLAVWNRVMRGRENKAAALGSADKNDDNGKGT